MDITQDKNNEKGKAVGLFDLITEEDKKELEEQYEKRMQKMNNKLNRDPSSDKLNLNLILPKEEKGEPLGLFHFLTEDELKQLNKGQKKKKKVSISETYSRSSSTSSLDNMNTHRLSIVQIEKLPNILIGTSLQRKESITAPVNSVKHLVFKLIPVNYIYGLMKSLLIESWEDGDVQCGKAVIFFLESRNQLHNFIQFLLKKNINESEQKTIQRMSTMLTWFLALYLKIKGSSYLKQVITPVINLITLSPYSFEIDMEKINPFFVSTNKILFKQVISLMLDNLHQFINELPDDIKIVLKMIKVLTDEKFNDVKVSNNASSSIFFLRFICPAMVSPKEYEITEEKLSNEVISILKNISKVITTWSNGVLYENDHPFFWLNDWIKLTQEKRSNLFEKLMSKELPPFEDEFTKFNPDQSDFKEDEEEINIDDIINKINIGNKYASFMMHKIGHYGEKIINKDHPSTSPSTNKKNNEKQRTKKIQPLQAYDYITRLLKKHDNETSVDAEFLDILKVFVDFESKKVK